MKIITGHGHLYLLKLFVTGGLDIGTTIPTSNTNTNNSMITVQNNNNNLLNTINSSNFLVDSITSPTPPQGNSLYVLSLVVR